MYSNRARRVAIIALTSWVLGLGALAGCGAHVGATPQFPQDVPVTTRQSSKCSGSFSADPSLVLAGIDGSVRRRIDGAVRANGLAVLSIGRHDCNTTVEVLRCSRAAGYDVSRAMAGRTPYVDARLSMMEDPHVAGGATLAAITQPGSTLSLDVNVVDRWSLSWMRDLQNAHVVSRYGPMQEGLAPLLHATELSEPDCERASIYVSAIGYGTYRVSATNGPSAPPVFGSTPIDASSCQLPSCVEPVEIQVDTIDRRAQCPFGLFPGSSGCQPGPSSFSSVLPTLLRDGPAAGSCEHPAPEPDDPQGQFRGRYPVPPATRPIAGQMTEQAAQAKRLFDGAKWGDAMLSANRVARGETGDDMGNRQWALYWIAVCWERLGDAATAMRMMQAIAQTPCHVAHDKAAFWVATAERRAVH